MIKKSFGLELNSTYQTVYEVPNSKRAEWVLLYVVNHTGSTDSFDCRVYKAANDAYIELFIDKSMSDGESFQMGGNVNEFVALENGDRIEAKNGASGFTLLVSVIEYNNVIQGG